MSGHHPSLAPSSIPALLHCAQFENDESDSRDTKARDLGTEHHREFARMLAGDRALADELEINERAGVEQAAAYVLGLYPASALVIEQPITVYDPDFEVLTWGTPDAWAHQPGGIPDLFDYKSGMWRNYDGQVAAYALGIMQQVGATSCHAHVIFGRSNGKAKRTWEYEEALKLVLEARERRMDKTLPAMPCDYCGWCAKAIRCEALARRAEAVRVGREDWGLAQYHASQIDDPVEMAKALALAKVMKKWADAVEHFATEMAHKQRVEIPGWKVKEKRGNREATDLQALYERAGLPIIDFLNCCDVSLPALEVVFAKKSGAESFAAGKRELARRLGDAVKHKKSSFFLTKTDNA